MINIVLTNIVKTYYPVNVCALNQNDIYINSIEFKNLIDKINFAFSSIREKKLNFEILEAFKKYDILKDIEEVTSESLDKCLSFKVSFFEDKTLYQLYVNLSVLVPYYSIYVLKNNFELDPYRWINLPERDKESETNKFDSHIKLISEIIQQKTLYTRFPETLLKTVIPDVNYSDIELGCFTYFNAFFLDDIEI